MLTLVEPLLCSALWISAFGSVLAIVISAAVPSAVVGLGLWHTASTAINHRAKIALIAIPSASTAA